MSAHPRVVSLRRGGRVPAGGVYVGRANPQRGLDRSSWANPWKAGADGTLEDVLDRYAARFVREPFLADRARRELAGKVLACWCVPDPCHASVLAWVADGEAPEVAFAYAMDGWAQQATLL